MTDAQKIVEDLAESRRELADAVSHLWARLRPPQAFAPDGPEGVADRLKAVMPALGAAGGAIRANPLASVLAGAGLAWLAWGGLRRLSAQPKEALPQWLVEAGALRAEAARLRSKVAKAGATGALDAKEVAESEAEIASALETETRRLMARGLDGLDEETRAAAIAAREAAWARHYGRKNRSSIGTALTSGPGLLAVGGVIAGLATTLMARKSPAERAVSEAEDAARDAADAARRVLEEEAARLSALADTLSRSLREILDEAEAEAASRD